MERGLIILLLLVITLLQPLERVIIVGRSALRTVLLVSQRSQRALHAIDFIFELKQLLLELLMLLFLLDLAAIVHRRWHVQIDRWTALHG